MTATLEVGKDGNVVIPEDLRARFGLEEGTQVVAEATEDGILIRAASDPDVEVYTPERIAEFLLNNAVSQQDYDWAVAEVRRLGLDPETIEHIRVFV